MHVALGGVTSSLSPRSHPMMAFVLFSGIFGGTLYFLMKDHKRRFNN
jgi:hypothetical protein